MERKTPRNLNMDLLRILSMVLIITVHSLDEHGGVLEVTDLSGGAMAVYARTLYMMSMVSVNCFVMLTGYFQVKSRFRIHKLMALWMEVVFYSLAIRIVFILFGLRPFSVASLISCLVPVFTGRYWFITIYFGLYLLSPFLNKAIQAMDRREHTMLVAALILLFSVWISVHPVIKGMNTGRGWGLAWFIVLYFFGSWFRLYYKPDGKIAGKLIGFFALSALVAMTFCLAVERSNLILRITDNWYKYDSFPTVVMTLLIFTVFLNLDLKGGAAAPFISSIATSTLGVYLIHSHADVSPWLWKTLNLPAKTGSTIFPVIQLGTVGCIFIGCSILDLIRMHTIGRLEKAAVIVMLGDTLTDIWKKTFEHGRTRR